MPAPAAKRFRPPNLSLSAAAKAKKGLSTIQIEDDSSSSGGTTTSGSVPSLDGDDGYSSPSLSSPDESSLVSTEEDVSSASDEFTKDLAMLEMLRQKVQTSSSYRRLRSNRSLHSLPKVNLANLASPPWRDDTAEPDSANSANSAYFTPLSSPISARFIGSANGTASASNSIHFASPLPPPVPSSVKSAQPVDLFNLADRLSSEKRPLLIDTRTPAAHISSRIDCSINIAIPSLILKRCRKPGGGLQTFDALRQFITTEQGKHNWDDLTKPGGAWDGDVIVYDEDMAEGATAWALLPAMAPLLSFGSVDYIPGGIAAARSHWRLNKHIRSGEDDGNTAGAGGTYQLNTDAAAASKPLPEIDTSSASPYSPLRSPMPLTIPTISDSSPSPPPSHSVFPRPNTVIPSRRPSIPALRRLDTSSIERLNVPKLSLRTNNNRPKSATLAVPPSISTSFSPCSSIILSNSPPSSIASSPTVSNFNNSPPRTPITPRPPSSPGTARLGSGFPQHHFGQDAGPETDPPTTEEAFAGFIISTILPHFLYLGPEPSTLEHVDELKDLGVKRILNIAIECGENDHGLALRDRFEKYSKIPMRDTVEEENISKGVKEVCELLDDARLHSAPTYVHCKAGKSRSVTAVIAYLIHANHWTLSKAYSFVTERRKGISPNIGFVSALMSFEETELGGKSVGVVQQIGGGGDDAARDAAGGFGGGNGGAQYHGKQPWRPTHHARESLPPVFVSTSTNDSSTNPDYTTNGHSIPMSHPMSAGGLAGLGDSGQEMEIKDSEGRYRHARRAPVDEATLQPLRRVSKAGLESSGYI